MKLYKNILLLCTAIAFTSTICAQRKSSLDIGWKFHRDAVINAEMADYDDSGWRTLTVPHDFSMEPAFVPTDYRPETEIWNEIQVGPFVRTNVGDMDQGQTIGGEGWYRKTIKLPLAQGETLADYLARKEVSIQFDGVYNHAEVWINGKKVAMNVYGYSPFQVSLNEALKGESEGESKGERVKSKDGEVKIAVKSLNVDQNSRWYAGSGIYRHVWLITTDKLHLNEWDVFVDGSEVLASKSAKVKVKAKVFNANAGSTSGDLKVDIIDHTGKVVSSTVKSFSSAEEVNTDLTVKSAHLWSIEDPYRYTARVSVNKDGKECDALTIPFGIRTLDFSVKDGFKLNGKVVKMKGGCVHHDNGLLGTASVDYAEIRKVEMLKAQGYNAVRCSHNLPSETFLNACDSLGMLVIDEVFDQWEKSKRPDDYSNFFSKEKQMIADGKIVGMGITNFEYDAALMVRRDRNHPSIVIWSIGNEIYQRSDERGKEIGLMINKIIKQHDNTRPTTLANCTYWDNPGKTWEKDSPIAFESTDIGGYNYAVQYYESDHEKFPERIMVGTETYPSAIAENWNFMDKHPYVIGDFVWTAIDYVGEAGVGHTFERTNDAWIQVLGWPWFNAWCGDIDLTGNKKPQSYFRDVVWGERKIAMAVRPAIPQGEHEEIRGWGWTAEENHWNWGKGYLPIELRPENYKTSSLMGRVVHDINAKRSDSLRVNVYSREKRVRLSINGKVVGEKDINPNNYTASFWVAYEPGELKAEVVDRVKGKVERVKGKVERVKGKVERVKSKVERVKGKGQDFVIFNTASAPTGIQLETMEGTVNSSHNNLVYVYINVVDKDGNLCPTAELPLKIETSGAKHIAIAGTGHPYDMKSFRSMTPTSFRGKALLIIQPQDESGQVKIKVTSEGIGSGECTVNFK